MAGRGQRFMVTLHRLVWWVSRARFGRRMGRADVLMLETVGKKTGRRRVTPLIYLPHPDGWVIVASAGGTDRHPDWFANLRARPEAKADLGRGQMSVQARVAATEEAEPLWLQLDAVYPRYAKYRRRTARVIPLVILERR